MPTSTTTTPRPRPELTSHDEYAIAVVGLGGIGSGAIYWAARRFGPSVVGLERFELGHERGASQDHSRIIRLSYHRPEYVRFAHAAFAAWADVEDHAGTQLVFRTGGLDLYPEGAFNWIADYVRSLDEAGDSYQWLDASETIKRWPQWNISDDVRVMFQDASGFVAADTANDVHRRLARELGATLLENTRVLSIRETGGMYELASEDAAFRAERVIITTDAWTNELLGQLMRPINLIVTQEQVTYYAPADLDAFRPERFPIWIWMGQPSFYGTPAFHVPGPKIGWDAGGPEVTGDSRSFDPRPSYSQRLDEFMKEHLPDGCESRLLEKTCLYAMPPDRDFVLDRIPGHDRVAVGQGAAHGFKFASVFGKTLVELVVDGKTESDVTGWAIGRDALTAKDPPRALGI